jgi:hypothetical protein
MAPRAWSGWQVLSELRQKAVGMQPASVAQVVPQAVPAQT